MNRFGGLIGAMAFAAITAACGNTAEGVKADAENAADATANAAANAGAAVENAGDAVAGAKQTADVKTALTADTRIDASNINVDTDGNAKTVTLSGRVPTAEMKTLAEQIAAPKAEGYRIVNNLTVGNP